jgi:ADP-L-glycero-D-manno-heptose 6-epimerase
MLWLWEHGPSGLFNSGTGTPRTFLDLATAVFAALGLPARISFTDMPADLAKQYQNYTCAEMSKLRSAGGTIPATDLEAGVRLTVRWLEDGAVTRAA